MSVAVLLVWLMFSIPVLISGLAERKAVMYEYTHTSHDEHTSFNRTHTITTITDTWNTNTNGLIKMEKETTYIINNMGNITSYTVKEPVV